MRLAKYVLAIGAAGLLFSENAYCKRKKTHLFDSIQKSIDSSMVKTPQDQEVCFSPDEPCDIKLVKFVESAQVSLDIAIYDINLDHLVHTILVKSKSIPVHIVCDRRQAKGGHSLVPILIKAGANIRYGHQRGIMHNKFVIVDGKAVETGSFNHTNHASTSNSENQIYLMNPKVVERYAKRFSTLWSESDPTP